VYFDANVDMQLSSPNFTSTLSYSHGAALYIDGENGESSAMLMTVLNCTGASITLAVRTSSIPVISDSNFVTNRLLLSCVYSSYYGHRVERCYFSAILSGKDIGTWDSSPNRKFEVNDCVFSGSNLIPSQCKMSGCQFNQIHMSTLVIWHIDMDNCPGVPAPVPGTEIPDATPAKTANIAASPAAVPTATVKIPNCTRIVSDRTTRYYLTEGCIDLSESTFVGLKPPDGTLRPGATESIYCEKGGAFSVNARVTSAAITDCLFWKCYVAPSGDYGLNPGFGGAIYSSAPRVQISQCCGQECYGVSGQFLYLDRKSGEGSPQRDLILTTLHLCAPANVNGGYNVIAAEGGISCANRVGLLASNVNVSMGRMTEKGASFYCQGEQGGFLLRYLTIAKCTAQTIFYSARQETEVMAISAANFLKNNGNGGIVVGLKFGFHLSDCIFMGNTPTGYDLMIPGSVSLIFSLVNCQISGTLPPATYWSGSFQSEQNPATVDLDRAEIRTCPTETPVKTARTATGQSPSISLSEKPLVTATDFPSLSANGSDLPDASAYGRNFPVVSASGSDFPVISASGSDFPVISASGSDFPVISASGSDFPVISVSESDFPVISASGSDFPVISVPGRDFPVISASGSAFPVISAPGSYFPVISASGSDFPVISASGSDFPAVSASGSDFPVISASGNDFPVISAYGNDFPESGRSGSSDELAEGANGKSSLLWPILGPVLGLLVGVGLALFLRFRSRWMWVEEEESETEEEIPASPPVNFPSVMGEWSNQLSDENEFDSSHFGTVDEAETAT
jgi:hypothetical protein